MLAHLLGVIIIDIIGMRALLHRLGVDELAGHVAVLEAQGLELCTRCSQIGLGSLQIATQDITTGYLCIVIDLCPLQRLLRWCVSPSMVRHVVRTSLTVARDMVSDSAMITINCVRIIVLLAVGLSKNTVTTRSTRRSVSQTNQHPVG